MLPTIRLRNRVIALLQDDGAELTTIAAAPTGGVSEIESSILEGVCEHSHDRPRRMSALGNGVAGDITVATFSAVLWRALVAWSDPTSFYRKIEYPINASGEPVVLEPGKDFISYPDDTEATSIRFIERRPGSGTNNVRISYNDLHAYLHPPDGLTVVTVGTAGATSSSYCVTALDAYGETLASPVVTITTGHVSPDTSNFKRLTWAPVHGAVAFNVYRTAGGGSQGRLGQVAPPVGAGTVSVVVTSYADAVGSTVIVTLAGAPLTTLTGVAGAPGAGQFQAAVSNNATATSLAAALAALTGIGATASSATITVTADSPLEPLSVLAGGPEPTGLVAGPSGGYLAYFDDTGIVAITNSSTPGRDTTLTSVEDRVLEPVARLCTANCLEMIANKKAGSTDEMFNGDTTDFLSHMERYNIRAQAHRAFYREKLAPKPEDVKGYITDKVVIPPPSHDGRFLFGAYNRRRRVR